MKKVSTHPPYCADLNWTEPSLIRIISRARRDNLVTLTPNGDKAAHSIAQALGVPVD